MSRARGLLVPALILAGLGASGCSGSSNNESIPPAVKVRPVAGTSVKRVVLSREAATRLGVRTGRARPGRVAHGKPLVVVPFDTIIYDPHGTASVFTNPAPLTFIRRPVRIARVVGEQAFLASGVPAGAAVVTEGAAELLGAETGVEE